MKKPKTRHVAGGPTPLKQYRFDPRNVFAALQAGKVESHPHFLFQRPHSFALLDRRPASEGHSLLVVNHPVATLLEDIPNDVMADVMGDLRMLMVAVQAATNCDGIQLRQSNGPAAGQTIPQLHFHAIPCYSDRKLLEGDARPELAAEAGGPLIARICNVLPESYSAGLHIWAASAEEMEDVGVLLQQRLVRPGMVVLLKGQLGAGKTTIARGFVRAFCKNPFLDVPSPTYLLCLSYAEDLGHDAKARSEAAGGAPSVHHMDPYRLGANADKMAGLIDFDRAFRSDVCLIEWPDRMPKEVLALPKTGVEVRVSGAGVQGVGRLLQVLPIAADDPCASVLRGWRAAGVPKVERTALPRNGASGGECLLFPAAEAISADPAQWLVLGIESSCDDTAAAVVRGDGHVLSHQVASQVGLHEQYGGVKPDVARQAHADAIHGVVAGCLEKAGLQPEQLTAVAATVGPGLALCLQVGVRHALSLASEHQLPFLPVHHMEAHALITRMPGISPSLMTYPALLLLVSGGHNMLVLCEGVGRYRVIGTSMDDSVGECFDKVARLLGITAIPGGPKLEELASRGDATRYKLTMPMQNGLYRDTCNFSFSGLKTSVARLVEQERERLLEECEEARKSETPAETQPGVGRLKSEAPAGAVGEEPDDAMEVTPVMGGTSSGNGSGPGVYEAGEREVTNGGEKQISPEVEERVRSGAVAEPCLRDSVRADIAAAFQSMCVKFLKQRTSRALQWLAQDSLQHGGQTVSCLVVAGGVAANKAVRAGMEEVSVAFGIPCICPPIKYCTDNGLMVAWTGIERLKLGLYKQPPRSSSAVDEHVEVVPRWPIGPLDPRSTVQGGLVNKMYR